MLNAPVRGIAVAVILMLNAVPTVAAESPPNREPTLPAHLRRPVALGLLDAGQRLAVANRSSGGVSLIETGTWTVIDEVPVGRGLSDLAVLPDGQRLLATDEVAHELIALRYADETLQVIARLPVSAQPVGLALNSAADRCYVTSLWSRRLTIVAVTSSKQDALELQVLRTVNLPFEPRKLLLLESSGILVVADAFGGQLAVVDAESGEVESVRELPAHNIHAMMMNRSGDAVLVAYQQLNPLAKTTFSDLHWGVLSNSMVSPVAVDHLLAPEESLLDGQGGIRLGSAGNGAADPAALAALNDEQIAVALAGTGEVLIAGTAGRDLRRFKTGRRPTALLAMPESKSVIVANTLSDSISIVRPQSDPPVHTISLGPTPDESPQVRGEQLFFDASLAHDRWMSCHSCHTEGHTNGLLADTLGDGSYGAPKRIPTLLGVGLTDLWAWDGSMKELQDQIDQSLHTTMHGDSPRGRDVNDLAAYLQSLNPPPPLRPPTDDPADRAILARGRELFHNMNCVQCHVPPITYTTGGAFDVGLADEMGNRKFNPPSLRGVGRRRGFFHDKRAKTLDAVFTEHLHQLDHGLEDQELHDLVRFLESL